MTITRKILWVIALVFLAITLGLLVLYIWNAGDLRIFWTGLVSAVLSMFSFLTLWFSYMPFEEGSPLDFY